MFELNNFSIMIPIIFMAMIYQGDSLGAQLRMCVYVLISTLAVLVKDQQGADTFFSISIVIMFLGMVLILKLNRKKDVADD